jgi:hypothetical protein
MSESQTSTPVATDRPGDLHIVLFGMPAAGKSSLLGALAQAAQTQEHLLNGHLVDVSHGLSELRKRLYEESGRRTAEEVVPYPVDFEPVRRDGRVPDHLGAVFIDCDGRVANDLLLQRQALDENSPEGTLAREVIDADTLVLVLDASAPPAQVEADFKEFDRFLRQMERGRGQRAEVGGLPVFLVLTKCDLLAEPGDKATDWLERIEQRKRDVGERFEAYLARRRAEGEPLPFGRIDLHVWATAVKQPALAGVAARPREPFEVAELFRQTLEAAVAFHNRRRRAGRRLLWTVSGGAAIVALMSALAGSLYWQHYLTEPNELQERIKILRNEDQGTPAERLNASEGKLQRREEVLAAIRNDPRFGSLPAADKEFVQDRLDELKAYLAYLDRVRQALRPGDVRTERGLKELTEKLKTELALPSPEWSGTEAGRLHRERLADAEALQKAVNRASNWYLDSRDRADALWTFKSASGGEPGVVNWQQWTAEVETLLAPDRVPPFAEGEAIPGSATRLTYATALAFDEVKQARAEWEAKRTQLRQVLDLASVLGLAPANKDRPAVLVIPRPFSLAQARQRREQLKKAYPGFQEEFVLERVPDAIRGQVSKVARTNYDNLLEPGQAAVLREFQQVGSGTQETVARWGKVRDWLRGNPEELADWRMLATTLARLQQSDARDPVDVLASFLGKTSFLIEVQRLTLEIPESLGVRPAADARLSIYHPSLGGERPALVLEQPTEGERDARRRVWVYRFRRVEGERITYRPGDKLWAELPLRDELQFTWSRDRSSMYQFEKLVEPPRLHKLSEANTAGTLERGVRVNIEPAEGVPAVPDLLPKVPLE